MIDPAERPFIAWDGEGRNVDGPDRPQHYTLFGCSAADPLISETHLNTFRILDHIIEVGRDNPTAFHVAFSFNYDANQIVRALPEVALIELHKSHKLQIRRFNGQRYFIHYIPSKWFSVTRYETGYHAKTNKTAKTTVKIYDLFTFFACSFVKAYKKVTGQDVSSVVSSGKDARNSFSEYSPEYVEKYWRVEIQQLRELAETLRERLYSAGLRIREWHGPGALASFVNRQYGIKQHMSEAPDAVREAARYAYAGGRFERFQLGRTEGPIYSLDINSAYPYAISQLPSLRDGVWTRVVSPKRIAKFGVYRVRLLPRMGGSFVERAPGPLFHRDKMGNISFPWVLEGWYWSPEVMNLFDLSPDRYEILEGWEYTGWSDSPEPFSFIPTMYEMRRKWKKDGNQSELALKLAMNSLYGKMAQRVGWNEANNTAPQWHQLEWAGWVTSYCRAMLWRVMSRIPYQQLLAVETDGLYTTMSPDDLRHKLRNSGGLSTGAGLGEWELAEYEEILYVQSGLAWLRNGEDWVCKRRGLDARTFELDACRNYLGTLRAGGEWAPYEGSTTRFVGMGAALQSAEPTENRLGVWEKRPREIKPGVSGKRIHVASQCSACKKGLNAYDKAHNMSIRSLAYKPGYAMSQPHDIPWENGDLGYEWREYVERERIELEYR